MPAVSFRAGDRPYLVEARAERRMKSVHVAMATVFCLWAPASMANDAAFKPLLADPAISRDDRCRNGIVAHRIEKWRQKDHIQSPPTAPFASVETIMKDVMPDAVSELQDEGCDPRYLWGFIACTQLDDPDLKSEQIIPRGVTAKDDAEMAAIMKTCIDEIAAAGIEPAL